VFIEDMLRKADSAVNTTRCGNDAPCGNTARVTPEEIFGDDINNL
jgi:hypothetical protein